MTFDTLRLGLRWTFWVLVWLLTGLLGAVLFLGTMPVPALVRWLMFAVVLGIVAEDVRRKLHPAPEQARH
ncbi:MAG TPA: hypothetical protein VES93_01600 [Ornithinibacter sp.]|nr:hypothetical protein [Ornithinibacter sp.]